MAEFEDKIEFVPRDKGFASDPNAESWKNNYKDFVEHLLVIQEAKHNLKWIKIKASFSFSPTPPSLFLSRTHTNRQTPIKILQCVKLDPKWLIVCLIFVVRYEWKEMCVQMWESEVTRCRKARVTLWTSPVERQRTEGVRTLRAEQRGEWWMCRSGQ